MKRNILLLIISVMLAGSGPGATGHRHDGRVLPTGLFGRRADAAKQQGRTGGFPEPFQRIHAGFHPASGVIPSGCLCLSRGDCRRQRPPVRKPCEAAGRVHLFAHRSVRERSHDRGARHRLGTAGGKDGRVGCPLQRGSSRRVTQHAGVDLRRGQPHHRRP